jgi:O-antigen ligase
MINSPDLEASVAEIQDLIGFISTYFVVLYLVKDERQIVRLLKVMLIVSGMVALFGIFQIFQGASWITSFMASGWGNFLNASWMDTVLETKNYYWGDGTTTTRIVGTFFNPDYYAAYLGYGISLVLGLIACRDVARREKFFLWIVFIITLINLIFTYSRGGWLSFGVVVLFFIFMLFRERKLRFFKFSMLSGIGLLLFIIFIKLINFGGDIAERVQTFPGRAQSDPRWIIWGVFLEKIKEHPFLGHGYSGTFEVPGFPWLHEVHAHSLYLQVVFIMGIVGLGCLLLLLTVYFRTVWNLYHRSAEGVMKSVLLGILGCIVWFIVHNGVDYCFFHLKNGMMFWSVLGLAMAVYRIQTKNYKILRIRMTENVEVFKGFAFFCVVLLIGTTIGIVSLSNANFAPIYFLQFLFIIIFVFGGILTRGRANATE